MYTLGQRAEPGMEKCALDLCWLRPALPGKSIMRQLKLDLPLPEGYEIQFRAFITLKNGRKLYAKQYGLRGFPIPVKVT